MHGGGVAEIDPFALIPATLAAEYANVTVGAVCNWVRRGHLPVADRDSRGRPLYRVIDVAKAERATAKAARRVA